MDHPHHLNPRALCLLLVAAACALIPLTAAAAQRDPVGLVDLVRRRAALDYRTTPRRVMAFYYPWYGLPDGPGGDGRNVHWGRIDPDRHDIAKSEHWPALGPYDSHDPKIIDRHCTWAKEAGIDTLILSWWGHGNYTDRPVPRILDACKTHGLSAALYYETCPNPKTPEATSRDLARIVERYGGHPAYLKADGRPVVFVYVRAMEQLGLEGWLRTAVLLNERSDPGVALIADGFSDAAARVFDGLHTYNTAGQIRQKPPEVVREWAQAVYPHWVGLAEKARRISTLTVIPGYDDTKIREPGLAVPRHDGRSYRVQWEEAIAADPHWVLITSFNEWHEGSEIEPSREHGRAYLDATAAMAKRFKSRPRTPHPPPEGAVAEADLARLRRRLDGVRIGVLPGAESPAFWFLAADVQADVRSVAWADVAAGRATPDAYPLLLYAAGEEYRTTVDREGDVDAGLEAYLAAGGFLLVMPSRPWPFFRNAEGTPVNRSARFGVSLRGGWEAPPEGRTLRLVQPDRRLPHLPAELPFPETGDLRWRPFVPDGHKRHVPLLALRDGSGKPLGEAIAYAEPAGGGRILYVWFRLLRGPRAAAVMLDAFTFAAGQLSR
jgi:hypothetical protein